MRAIRVHEVGGPEVLRAEELPVPEPGPGEVLVRLLAIGVNFIDTYKRKGLYPVPAPFTLGEEGAGVVEKVGEGVVGVRPGDRVAFANVQGAYAEYLVVPAERLVPVPEGLDPKLAAAALLQGMTVHYLLKSTYPVAPGDQVLVHAGAGGWGSSSSSGPSALGPRSTPRPAPRRSAGSASRRGPTTPCPTRASPRR